MSWLDIPWLAFDLESTGLSRDDDRIATACAAIVAGGEVTYQREWMIAVDVEVNPDAAAVNKLTTERLRAEGRPAAEVIPEIVNALRYALRSGMPIVAYNGCFDLTFVDREAARWMGQTLTDAVGLPIRPVLDPFVVWKQVERFRKGKRTLSVACEAFGVDLGDKAHEATADAIGAARVMLALAKANPSISRMTLPKLHEAQAAWFAGQQASFKAYKESRNESHDGCDPSWPLKIAAPAVST